MLEQLHDKNLSFKYPGFHNVISTLIEEGVVFIPKNKELRSYFSSFNFVRVFDTEHAEGVMTIQLK